MHIPRIDPKNLLGLVDKAIGLGKEIVGSVFGNDDLAQAGQVQQEKASERIKAMRAEVRADAHEAKATAAEQAQKRAQRAKETVNS
jgi:uncharacterized protein YjbJ (UPF0337 family)